MARHLPFQPRFVWSALSLGIFAGFGLGAYLVFSIAFTSPPSKLFTQLVQIHGHLQLLGWTGLFILGISLYKLPRLMSSRPIERKVADLIFAAVVAGLLLRSGGQLLLPFFTTTSASRAMVLAGCLLESGAVLLYLSSLLPPLLAFDAQRGAIAARAMKPFLVVSFAGWALYALVNAYSGWQFMSSDDFQLDLRLNNAATELYIHLVLLPTCFAFSLGTFPIFLRLRAPDWPVRHAALLYFAGASLSVAAELGPAKAGEPFGIVLRAAAVFWTAFELDLVRRKAPWFEKFRIDNAGRQRMPRASAADYGQFGNFEWLIYASYCWLAVAVVTELSTLWSAEIPRTVTRHLYLLGFVTHLILGMAVRIVPGFLGQSRVAYPVLVRWSFLFISLSILGRTAAPAFSVWDVPIFRVAYGLSGVFAMLALACLGVNLRAAVLRRK